MTEVRQRGSLSERIGQLSVHSAPEPLVSRLASQTSFIFPAPIETPLLLQSEPEQIEDGNYVHGWHFSAQSITKQNGQQAVQTLCIDDTLVEMGTRNQVTLERCIIDIQDGPVPQAQLYYKKPPFRPFPARPFAALPDEAYQLPLDLIQAANGLPDKAIKPNQR